MMPILFMFTFFHFATCLKNVPRYRKKYLHGINSESDVCNLCSNSMVGITSMLKDGFNDDEIQAQLLGHCTLYPIEYSKICETIGSTYFPIFSYLAKQGVSENKACLQMGYCSDLEAQNF